jgi:mono/diheme cytochrome c family protein
MGAARASLAWVGAMAVAAATAVATSAAVAGSPAEDAPVPAGQALYTQRCAPCHDQVRADVPPRSQLVQRSPQFIADKLVFGSMQGQVLGLSDADIDTLSAWLGGGT